jgi:hypothetical protein
MQTEPGNFRYRGWRESRDLVEMAKSVPCDLKTLTDTANDNEIAYTTAQDYIDTLTDDRASTLEHLFAQLAYRLRRED